MVDTWNKKSMDVMSIQDCVEGSMKVHIQKDKEEEAEKAKRKTSVIIHKLSEPQTTDDEDRIAEDAAQIAELMDKISCADVNIKKIIQLGRRPEQPDAAARPIKLVFESEAHKEQVLESAEKLEEHQGRRFCQDIYSPGPNSQGEGSEEETCRGAETTKSRRGEGLDNCQWEDSGEKDVPILKENTTKETAQV